MTPMPSSPTKDIRYRFLLRVLAEASSAAVAARMISPATQEDNLVPAPEEEVPAVNGAATFSISRKRLAHLKKVLGYLGYGRIGFEG